MFIVGLRIPGSLDPYSMKYGGRFELRSLPSRVIGRLFTASQLNSCAVTSATSDFAHCGVLSVSAFINNYSPNNTFSYEVGDD